ETISAQIQLSPLHWPTIISSKSSGAIKHIAIIDSQVVSKDEQLILAVSDSSGEEYSLAAPTSVKAIFIMDIKEGKSLSKKEPLIAIIPANFNSKEIITTGMIEASNKKNISVGQTVDVELANYPQETYGRLKGKIYRISPVAIGDNYIFNVVFETDLITSNNYKINVQDKLN